MLLGAELTLPRENISPHPFLQVLHEPLIDEDPVFIATCTERELRKRKKRKFSLWVRQCSSTGFIIQVSHWEGGQKWGALGCADNREIGRMIWGTTGPGCWGVSSVSSDCHTHPQHSSRGQSGLT